MRSEFLDREQQEYNVGGPGALLGSLYGWSVLGMLSEFSKTGEYYVPWAGLVKKGGVRVSAIGKTWGIEAAEAGNARVAKGFGPLLFGKKFIGKGPLGATQLFASSAVGVGLSGMTWTDPVFYAFEWAVGGVARSTLPLAIGWFGGTAVLNSVARAMERTRYVGMNQRFPETQASFTSRQRAVRAIAESHLQARSAVGNEAMLFHR